MGFAAVMDWPGLVFDALVLGALFLRGFVLRRFLAPLAFERFATLWASAVSVCVAIFVVHAVVFQKLDHLGELLRQGEFRSAGSDAPLSDVLATRKYWLSLAFTPLAIVLGKLG